MNKSTAQVAQAAKSLSPRQGILQRNCACGNHTVAGGECAECGKNKSRLQRKLTIGASSDPLELEADRIANQVMTAPAHHAVSGAPPRIQRFTGQLNGQLDAAPASVDRVLARSGRPLESALRQDMEQRFGYDFSRVRVHADGEDVDSARAVQARAYTLGGDIVFGAGEYETTTAEGKKLLSHELVHVIQQRGDVATSRRGIPILQRAPLDTTSGKMMTDPDSMTGLGLFLTSEGNMPPRPVISMTWTEINKEIRLHERWLSEHHQSSNESAARKRRLDELYTHQRALSARLSKSQVTKRRKPTGSSKHRTSTPMANEPQRPKTLDDPNAVYGLSKASSHEVDAEIDRIVDYLADGNPTAKERVSLTSTLHLLQDHATTINAVRDEQQRRRRIDATITPTHGAEAQQFEQSLRTIESIRPDELHPGQWVLPSTGGALIPVAPTEVLELRNRLSAAIVHIAAELGTAIDTTFEEWFERHQHNKEHKIVHGLVKWATGANDLDPDDMQRLHKAYNFLQKRTITNAKAGALTAAGNDVMLLDQYAKYIGEKVGRWENDLMGGAQRWVTALTLAKEGLTLLATAGAGSLFAGTARTVGSVRAALQVASATTFAGGVGAFGGELTSQVVGGEGLDARRLTGALRVGSSTGFQIGAAPGLNAAANSVFKVGMKAGSLLQTGKVVAAETTSDLALNIGTALLSGDSLGDAAHNALLSAPLSSLSNTATSKFIAKIGGGKSPQIVTNTIASFVSSGTVAAAYGKSGSDLVYAGLEGAGGHLFSHGYNIYNTPSSKHAVSTDTGPKAGQLKRGMQHLVETAGSSNSEPSESQKPTGRLLAEVETSVTKGKPNADTAPVIQKEEALAKKPTDDGHEVVVTKDGVGKCSPTPCPVIHFEYAKELAGNPGLKSWNEKVQELRKTNPDEAAKEAASLIRTLDAARSNAAKSGDDKNAELEDPFALHIGEKRAEQIRIGEKHFPIDRALSFDIDEVLPVGASDIKPQRAVDRARSAYNRQLLDPNTNQRTKGLGIDPRELKENRGEKEPISVKDAPSALLTRRFSEVHELKRIFDRAVASVKEPQTLTPTELKARINKETRRIITEDQGPDAVAVREALTALGFEHQPGRGFTMMKESPP